MKAVFKVNTTHYK